MQNQSKEQRLSPNRSATVQKVMKSANRQRRFLKTGAIRTLYSDSESIETYFVATNAKTDSNQTTIQPFDGFFLFTHDPPKKMNKNSITDKKKPKF